MPVYTLLETPCSPDFSSRLFLTDDPALVVLYSQLRHQTLQTLRGASKVTPKVEWEFVLHSAKLYDRMGCDLLGLDLGKCESLITMRRLHCVIAYWGKKHVNLIYHQFGTGSFSDRVL